MSVVSSEWVAHVDALKRQRDLASAETKRIRAELYDEVEEKGLYGTTIGYKLRGFVDDRIKRDSVKAKTESDSDYCSEEEEDEYEFHPLEIVAIHRVNNAQINERRWQLLTMYARELQADKNDYFHPWINSKEARAPAKGSALVHVVYTNPHGVAAATFEVFPEADSLLSVLWAARALVSDDEWTMASRIHEAGSSIDTVVLMNKDSHWKSYMDANARTQERRRVIEVKYAGLLEARLVELEDRFFHALWSMEHLVAGASERKRRNDAVRAEIQQIEDDPTLEHELNRLYMQVDSSDEEDEDDPSTDCYKNNEYPGSMFYEMTDEEAREQAIRQSQEELEKEWVEEEARRVKDAKHSWYSQPDNSVSRAVCVRHVLEPIHPSNCKAWIQKQRHLQNAAQRLKDSTPHLQSTTQETAFGTLNVYPMLQQLQDASASPRRIANVLVDWHRPLSAWGLGTDTGRRAILLDWDERTTK